MLEKYFDLVWGKDLQKNKMSQQTDYKRERTSFVDFQDFQSQMKTKNAKNVADLVTLLLQSKFALTVILKVKVLLNSTPVNKTKRAN